MSSNNTQFTKGHSPWNAGRGEHMRCLQCSTEMWVPRHAIGTRKFCSRACGYKGRVCKGLFEKGHADLVPETSRGHSDETRNKLAEYQRSNHRIGQDSPNWKGGKRTERKQQMARTEYKEWRKAVFSRDGYMCIRCKGNSYLHADHIIRWADDATKRYDIDNGRTLCYKCHYYVTFGVMNEEKALRWGVPQAYRGSVE